MASSNSGGVPFPRWQIALAVGATGVIGLSYWYFRQQSKGRPSLANIQTAISIDDAPEDKTPKETPLEQAIRYKNEGNALFKKGKYDEAITMYNKAIEACPEKQQIDLAMFYQNRAAAYEQLKKWSSVISDCTKALEANQKYEKALYRRARAYEAVKDWEKCLDDVTAVCLLQNFQNQNVLAMADRVLKELGKHHAAEAMKTKKPKLPSKQFIKTYFISFSEDPVYAKLMSTADPIGAGNVTGFLKAKLAFATEQYDDIIPACTEEINSSEAESSFLMEALSLRASFHLLCGSHKEALEDFKTIINSADGDVKIKVNSLIKRAALYMQMDNIEECLKDFTTAAELGPGISDVYHHRGQVKLLMDQTEEAIKDFAKAVELNPDFAIAYVQKCYADYRYAMITQNVALLMDSMRNFKKAVERFSTCSEALVLYGQVLAEKQDYEEADKLYLKAIEIEPNNATTLVHRGLVVLQYKQDIDKAVDLMKAAIKVDEKCEFAYETLGTVEVQRGNLIIAIDLFNSAIELARTETEMVHLFSLRDAAISQQKIATKLGIGPQRLKSES